MTLDELIRGLLGRGATLRVERGSLICSPPPGGLSERESELLRHHRDELVALLSPPGTEPQDHRIPPLGKDRARIPTFDQERLWVVSRLDRVGGAYNQGMVLRLRGPLEPEALDSALSRILERHEVLRARYPAVDGVPTVAVDPVPEGILGVEMVGDGSLPATREHSSPRSTGSPLDDPALQVDPFTEASRRAAEIVEAPYDLERGPLFRSMLLRLGERDHLLVLGVHHIAFDAWSWGVLREELTAFYTEAVTGLPAGLSSPQAGYFDFAGWHRDRMEASPATVDRDLAYWRERLRGAPRLDLPTRGPRPAVTAHDGDVVRVRIPEPLRRRVEEAGQAEGATLFMTLLAAFQLLLARLSGQDDIVVGVPEAGRTHPSTEAMIGFFARTLAIRTRIPSETTFPGLLRLVRSGVLGALEHQHVPFDRVVREVEVDRDLGRSPVFQAMFSFPGVETGEFELPGLDVTKEEIERHFAIFDLTLWVRSDSTGLVLDFEYRTDLFDRRFIADCADRYLALLERALGAPDLPVLAIPLLSESETRRLVRERAGPVAAGLSHGTFLEWVKASVEEGPSRTAIEGPEGDVVSYGELWERSGRIAANLGRHGVGRGAVVGIMMERTTALLAVLLGVLRTGAAYLPLDPEYPADRIRYMLEDGGAALVVLDGASDPDPAMGPGIPAITASELDPPSGSPGAAEASGSGEVGPDGEASEPSTGDMAYLIYTSGSTGTPKGVEVLHGSVRNFLGSMRDQPGFGRDDTLLAVTTLSFDISVLELFLPLTVGGRVVLANREVMLDGRALARRLGRGDVSVMQATPATWRLLLGSGWEGRLERILCGGEALPPELAAELLTRGEEVWNLYGPTETTVWSTLDRVRASGEIRVGRPIANTRVYVLDRNGCLVPDGVVGEVWIAGAGLARGYHGRADMTREAFRRDPFVPGERMYRTGDLGRWDHEGRLEHLGRQDLQVKVNGFRIELGEIETALERIPEIREAVVKVSGGRESPRLVAYAVFEPGEELLAGEVRRAVSQTLPQHMIPGIVVPLDSFPVTPNRKVDRTALPDPFAGPTAPSPEPAWEPPETPLEKSIAAIWKELLEVDRVGRHDNFFELGGHSLLVMRAVARLEERHGRSLDPRDLFFRTLSQLATGTGEDDGGPARSIGPDAPGSHLASVR